MLSILIVLFSVANVSCGSSFYVYNLAVDMIRETDVVFNGGFRTQMTLEEYIANDSLSLQIAEIHSQRPRFSWQIFSTKKNTYQRKYRILVATSKELIDNNKGDVWDSGLVTDSSSVAVVYGGGALSPATLYYWKVMIVDDRGRKSDFSDAKGFVTAHELDDYTSVLPLEKLKQQPQNITINGTSALIDFGNDAFGQLALKLNSLLGNETVALHLGEALDSSGRVNQKPSGSLRYRRFTVLLDKGYSKYKIKIDPISTNTDPNVNNGAVPVLMPDYIGEVMPFRYVQIDNYKHHLVYHNFIREMVVYPFDDDAAEFRSDDTLLNQIWNLCKHTMKATTFAGAFVDGDRERITYEADTYINQLSFYAVSDQYSIARNSLERLIYHSTWPTEWILQTALIAYNDYLYTGDISFLQNNYENLKMRTLWNLRNSDDHLLYSGKDIKDSYLLSHINTPSQYLRDIIDWPPSEQDDYKKMNCNTVVNAFYYKALSLFAEIAAALDNNYDAACFRKYAQEVREAINKKMLGSDSLYFDAISSKHSSLHANMLPLAMGIVNDTCRTAVLNFIKKRGMVCSPYGAQFLLDAVFEAMDPDYALSLLTDTSQRSWYQMIRSGSTMTTEGWSFDTKDNQDWNHAWGAAPANIISRRLMGIEPTKPGFARVRIAPQIGRLGYAYIKQPTPRGIITVEIKPSGTSKKRFSVVIPPNMTADIVLPDGSTKVVGSGRWDYVLKIR
ncbi:MAG: family 78 glycoside hydrolase catalytic domain [Bacteroidales bacterium]|nr:family 78 glycoside hydrolase catalytic domain [Bacteroidales bacterium]